MSWKQIELTLKPRPRGFHLVMPEILPAIQEPLRGYETGLAHIFIQHTSASLSINENADPDVRADLESHFNHMVPENQPYYLHTLEGSDDMPAHIKHSLLGSSLMVPVQKGELALGLWQGIYLCEHRNHAGSRRLIVTLNGALISK